MSGLKLVSIKTNLLLLGVLTDDLKCFEESYVNILKSFKSSQKYVILGDSNIHYDKINKLSGITDYVNHVQSVGCIQLIDKPTRMSASCSSIIDHIYTNSAHTSQVTPTITYDDISDHMSICAEITVSANLLINQFHSP